MAVNPQFVTSPKTEIARLSVAYTDRSGNTAGLTDLITGTGQGTKIGLISIKYTGISVAANLLVFITDTSGLNPRLFDEIPISAVSPSATVQSFGLQRSYFNLQLAAGQKIQIGVTALSGSIPCDVIAFSGDF